MLKLSLPLKYCFILLVYMVMGLYLIAQSIYPVLADFHYKTGYRGNVFQVGPSTINDFKTACAYAPWEPYYRFCLGKTLSHFAQKEEKTKQIKMLKESVDAYKLIISQNLNEPSYKFNLSNVYLTLTNVDKDNRFTYIEHADKYSAEAADVDHHNPLHQFNRALFLQKLGRTKEAISYFDKTVSLDNTFINAYYSLGQIYASKGQNELAIKNFSTVYDLDRTFPQVPIILAQLHLSVKQPEKALSYLEAFKQQDPNHPQLAQFCGIAHFMKNQWTEAIQYCETHYSQNPQDLTTLRYLSAAYTNNGMKDKAMDILYAYLEVHQNEDKESFIQKMIGI